MVFAIVFRLLGERGWEAGSFNLNEIIKCYKKLPWAYFITDVCFYIPYVSASPPERHRSESQQS